MLRKKLGRIEWLEFELFEQFPQLAHAIFLRKGGVSKPPFESLNFSSFNGDCPNCVAQNIALTKEILNFQTLSYAHLIQSDIVLNVENGQSGNIGKGDGLITQEKGNALLATHADCQTAIFYDPIKNVVANVHAGWRGNVQKIYTKTIQRMVSKYGCKTSDIFIGISPSLGPKHAQFINYKTELPSHFMEFQVKPLYFNLWEAAKAELLEAGIEEAHIQLSEMCTFEKSDDFFSFRREGKISGRHATIALIN